MTVLVTGASRGIGKSIAKSFAKKGHTVIINCSKSEDELNGVKSEILLGGGKCDSYVCDVSDEKAVSAMFSDIQKKYGGVDILINNAGISMDKLLISTSYEDWKRTFAVNTDSAFNCTKAVYDYMVSKKWGRIINVSSIWGIAGASCEVAYSASKAALIGFTKALAKELGPSGITVNCICPGVIDTKMNSHLSPDDINALIDETPVGRLGTGDDIAPLCIYLASDEASFVTGQIISPNGGFII